MTLNRRTFLKGIGATLAVPYLESIAAPAEARPIRMAVLYMANGVHSDAWTPKGAGREFELSPTLSPLAGVKDDLLVLSELWNAASNTGDGHYVKTGGFLTSTTITRTTGEALNSNGISMDQLAAKKVGILTPLPSLELGLEPPATGVDSNVGYTQLYGAHIAWNQPTTPGACSIWFPRMPADCSSSWAVRTKRSWRSTSTVSGRSSVASNGMQSGRRKP
jgi:hypothetical protein